MSDDTPATPTEATIAPGRPGRRVLVPVALVAAGLVVGGGVGAGIVAASAGAQRDQITAQLADVTALNDRNKTALDESLDTLRATREQLNVAEGEARRVAERAAELDQRETAVQAREVAVTATEQQIAATTIHEGIWTVGVDIEPGSYRAAAPVGSRCYWAIYRTGSNGDDIIQNDVVSGGIPRVTLSTGQDFNTSRCGDWVKE